VLKMDKSIFKPIEDKDLMNIFEGDPRLKLIEMMFSLDARSTRSINMYWPMVFKDFYVENGRLTSHQYNVLLSIYEKELKIEEEFFIDSERRRKSFNPEEYIEEKIIPVKFA